MSELENILQFYQLQAQGEQQGIAVDWRVVANRMAVMLNEKVNAKQVADPAEE